MLPVEYTQNIEGNKIRGLWKILIAILDFNAMMQRNAALMH